MNRGFNRVMLAILFLVLAFMYIPILTIIGMSFNATPYGMFPYVFTTEWYETLFTTSNLPEACWLSLKFSLLVALAALIVGTAASYGLQYFAPRAAKRFNFFMRLPIIIPWLVTSVSILLLATFVGSGRSYMTMFLGNLICVLPYVVLLVNARFEELDRRPEDAARLLGASPLRAFWDITLPAILPGALAGGIMALIVCFNNFSLQYYLSPVSVDTLPVTVFTRIKSGYQADLNALSAIITLVAVLLVLLVSRMGFSAGSLFGLGGTKKAGKENEP